jgi:hypothetical protein
MEDFGFGEDQNPTGSIPTEEFNFGGSNHSEGNEVTGN